MTTYELRALAEEILETRGVVPELAQACRDFSASGDDPYAELLACLAAMQSGDLADENVVDAAYVAAVVITYRS